MLSVMSQVFPQQCGRRVLGNSYLSCVCLLSQKGRFEGHFLQKHLHVGSDTQRQRCLLQRYLCELIKQPKDLSREGWLKTGQPTSPWTTV